MLVILVRYSGIDAKLKVDVDIDALTLKKCFYHVLSLYIQIIAAFK